MPKKKKVSKAEVKASIKRLHKAAKKKEKLEVKAVEPVAVRELPPQPEVAVSEVKEVSKAPPVEEPVEEEASEEIEESAEEAEEPRRDGRNIVIGDSVEFGWKSVKSHLWFFVGVFLLFFVLSFMIAGASAIATKIVLGVFVAGISLGYFKLAVDVVGGKSPEFKELFSCFSLLLKYLVATIIYFAVVAVGLVLFVVPGIIWAVQFGFYPYIVVKERLGPVKALRKSSELAVGVKSRLVTFALALIGINLLGVVALGIGVIITIPLSIIAGAHLFHQLEKSA